MQPTNLPALQTVTVTDVYTKDETKVKPDAEHLN